MGDIADMMLDGTICAGCGEFLDSGGAGIPMYCGGCRPHYSPARISGGGHKKPRDQNALKTWGCSGCTKSFFRKAHAADHCKVVGHGEPVDRTIKIAEVTK